MEVLGTDEFDLYLFTVTVLGLLHWLGIEFFILLDELAEDCPCPLLLGVVGIVVTVLAGTVLWV